MVAVALALAPGEPTAQEATRGTSGRDVGNELDLTARVIFTPRVNLLLGFSQFWGGDLVDATNPSFVSGSASFAYAQLSLRF